MQGFKPNELYVLFTDGGSRGNPGPSAYGAILQDKVGKTVSIGGKYMGHSTNNRAEYEGIYQGALMALRAGVKRLQVYIDSELAYKQITGKWKVKDSTIKTYVSRIEKLSSEFETIQFEHTPRSGNALADRIVNLILDTVEVATDAS